MPGSLDTLENNLASQAGLNLFFRGSLSMLVTNFKHFLVVLKVLVLDILSRELAFCKHVRELFLPESQYIYFNQTVHEALSLLG